MKISVLQENLSRAVSAVARNITTRPQLPVLSNMLLKAQKGKLLLIGTDLSLTVGFSIGGKIEEEGAITVPAKDFSALVSGLTADRVELSEQKGILSVKAGPVRAKLIGISSSEFPDIESKAKEEISLSRSALLLGARQTLFAIGQDDSRPILTGVKMEQAGGGELRMLSTDGYRLSSVKVPEVKKTFSQSIVIPGRVLSEAVRLLTGDEAVLQLLDDGGIRFLFDGGWVAGRLLAGEFPPAERIIPEKFDTKIIFERTEFEQAVRIAAVFARESANIVRLKISKGKLTISANSPQIGENETEIETEEKGTPVGPPAGGEIAFNSRYLLDWVGSLESPRVEFGMAGPLKPGVFRPVLSPGGAQGEKSYIHVIMPVRTQKEKTE